MYIGILKKGGWMKKTLFFLLLMVMVCSIMVGASYEQASMLFQHGLVDEAKSQLIQVIFVEEVESEKAAAYYLLGTIAFAEDNIQVALETWKELMDKYPDSWEAEQVERRIVELAEMVGDTEKESLHDILARSYLQHGDFWSRGKSTTFSIDTSWIPKVEAAIKWYDRVIEEFPITPASLTAYEKKLQTLLGWTDPGTYGQSHGIREDFDYYMPIFLETLLIMGKLRRATPIVTPPRIVKKPSSLSNITTT